MFQNTFEKRMLNTTVPQGMGQALEEDWWPDKPLDPYTSPSWQWKKQRLHLAKGENRNKAGKKKGCGTTSLTRQMKRHHLQQDPSDRDGDGNPWERDGSNSWERGWWREDGWGSSRSWEAQDWQAQDWQGQGWRSPSRRRRRRHSRSSSSSRSASPLQKGTSKSPSRPETPDWSPGRSSSRSSSRRPKKTWQVKEKPIPEEPGDEKMEEEKKDGKMEEEKNGEKKEERKKDDTPLEKGCNNKDMKVEEKKPLEKGSIQDVKIEEVEGKSGSSGSKDRGGQEKSATPLEKGDSKMEEVKQPLKKGRVMVDYHNTLEVRENISQANQDAVATLLEKGYQVTICTWCGAERAAKVRQHLEQMPWWDDVQFLHTSHRKGPGAKPDLAKRHGCFALFDDAQDICEEAYMEGLKVFPIQLAGAWGVHRWANREGVPQFSTFVEAVAFFLGMLDHPLKKG